MDGMDLCSEDGGRPGTQHTQQRMFLQDTHHLPGKNLHHLRWQRSSPHFSNSPYCYNPDECNLGRAERQNTKSPDSGLDCGSEEESSLGRVHRAYYVHRSHMQGPVHIINCEGPVERRALAMGRKRTLTRQCSVEEEFSDSSTTAAKMVHMGDFRNRDKFGPGRQTQVRNHSRDGELNECRLNELHRVHYSPHWECRVQCFSRLNQDHPLVCDFTLSAVLSISKLQSFPYCCHFFSL